ncbi:MAG: hypothetical protein NWS53_08105 [Salibacteraceae bacterium]|nr:hypothetical protein [Salibacteraceae bacterium]
MKKSNIIKFLLMAVLFSASAAGCKKDPDNPNDPQDPNNEPEQITKVKLTFTNDSTNAVSAFTWADDDGVGGLDPIIDEIVLSPASSYSVAIDFIDGSGVEDESLTPEITTESDEHLVCFEPNSELANSISIDRTDTDGTFEIGLTSTWVTGQAAEAAITISLKHQPDGAKDGTCTPGETDVEVIFVVKIQ